MKQKILLKFPHLRQFEIDRRWPSWGLLATVILAGLIYAGIYAKLNSSEWASWVQAFGSIGAIIGAWALGRQQSKAAFIQALRLKRIEEALRIRAFLPIAARALELINELADEPFDSYYRERYDAASFRTCLSALTAIPLHELGRYGLVEGYLKMQQALEAATLAAEKRLEVGQMNLQRRFDERASDAHIDRAQIWAEQAFELIRDNSPRPGDA